VSQKVENNLNNKSFNIRLTQLRVSYYEELHVSESTDPHQLSAKYLRTKQAM
jgi:hypothetical protein